MLPTLTFLGFTLRIYNIETEFKPMLARGAFLGTALSIIQSPTSEKLGVERKRTLSDPETKPPSIIEPLLAAYAVVPALALTNSDPRVRNMSGEVIPDSDLVVKRLIRKVDLADRVHLLGSFSCL